MIVAVATLLFFYASKTLSCSPGVGELTTSPTFNFNYSPPASWSYGAQSRKARALRDILPNNLLQKEEVIGDDATTPTDTTMHSDAPTTVMTDAPTTVTPLTDAPTTVMTEKPVVTDRTTPQGSTESPIVTESPATSAPYESTNQAPNEAQAQENINADVEYAIKQALSTFGYKMPGLKFESAIKPLNVRISSTPGKCEAGEYIETGGVITAFCPEGDYNKRKPFWEKTSLKIESSMLLSKSQWEEISLRVLAYLTLKANVKFYGVIKVIP